MRHRLPLIFSTTALFVALLAITPLGEAAYNAVVPRNSIGTLQLQRNAVKAAKIAPNAIRTGHVLDGSLLAADFKAGQLPSGPKGDKGDKGEKGDKGLPGPAGISALQVVTQQSPLDSTVLKFVVATCPGGKIVIGGGADTNLIGVDIYRSSPAGTAAWGAGANETSPTSSVWYVKAYAYCAKVSP